MIDSDVSNRKCADSEQHRPIIEFIVHEGGPQVEKIKGPITVNTLEIHESNESEKNWKKIVRYDLHWRRGHRRISFVNVSCKHF